MLTGKGFEVSVMLISFGVFCASYLLFVRKDRSWINWATPAFLTTVGARYVLQFAYLCFVAPGGSRYAYAFCYATYALSFLVSALVYTLVRPFRFKISPREAYGTEALPWALLFLGFLFYLPVLIEFREYIAQPRMIYSLTRIGYGLWFYTSTTLTTLGFVTYLFKRHKSVFGGVVYYSSCTIFAYWHGSKGQIVTGALIWGLYVIYGQRRRIGFVMSLGLLLVVAALVLGSFALFETAADLQEFATGLTNYSDYVRNAMMVIDDPRETRYYGSLLMGNELYSRIPRALMPSKPKDFGSFLLAKVYYPAAYRLAAGDPAFDLGIIYADFGPASILLVCLFSAITTWFMSSLVASLRRRPTPGVFIVFLFMAGILIIPLGNVFLLPETILLAGLLAAAGRVRWFSSSVVWKKRLPGGAELSR